MRSRDKTTAGPKAALGFIGIALLAVVSVASAASLIVGVGTLQVFSLPGPPVTTDVAPEIQRPTELEDSSTTKSSAGPAQPSPTASLSPTSMPAPELTQVPSPSADPEPEPSPTEAPPAATPASTPTPTPEESPAS